MSYESVIRFCFLFTVSKTFVSNNKRLTMLGEQTLLTVSMVRKVSIHCLGESAEFC